MASPHVGEAPARQMGKQRWYAAALLPSLQTQLWWQGGAADDPRVVTSCPPGAATSAGALPLLSHGVAPMSAQMPRASPVFAPPRAGLGPGCLAW